MRTFETGATRDIDHGKLDFEGFLSPLVIERFAQYMHEKRFLKDGSMRASDNWQLGIPREAYMKSAWRHFFAVWKSWRKGTVEQEEVCALMFNIMGLLHETLKAPKVEVKPGPFCENCERLADVRHEAGTFWCGKCAAERDEPMNRYTLMERA